jgi:hypothetical protein
MERQVPGGPFVNETANQKQVPGHEMVDGTVGAVDGEEALLGSASTVGHGTASPGISVEL